MSDRPQSQSTTRSGYLLAVGATILWAGNFVLARGLHKEIPPVSLAFWRWVTAVAALAPFALRATVADWQLVRRHLAYLSVTALLGVTMFNTLIYTAGHTTNAINLALIAASSPIFIVLLARLFYGERISATKAIGTLVAVSGVVVLITNGSFSRVLEMTFAIGDVWMLGAAITFAGYNILVKRKPDGMSMQAFLLSTFGLGTLFLLPVYLWEHLAHGPVTLNRSTLLAVLYVGVFASLAAFFAWNRAITIIGTARTAVVYYLTPVFSGIGSSLFLGETISVIHVLSVALIIIGILIANRAQQLKEVS